MSDKNIEKWTLHATINPKPDVRGNRKNKIKEPHDDKGGADISFYDKYIGEDENPKAPSIDL